MEKKKKKPLKIIGLDEAGRGSLAGPVIAVAVKIKNVNKFVSDFSFNYSNLKITDSKKISPLKRQKLCDILSVHSCVEWGIGIISEKKIDKINILESTKIAMEKSLENINFENSFLIIDGNFNININCRQKPTIKADEKILECSIASIIAKVKRDEIMQKYHKKYPKYGLSDNKGYGTKRHIYAIKKYGLCPIHRKTFKIKKLKKSQKPRSKEKRPLTG